MKSIGKRALAIAAAAFLGATSLAACDSGQGAPSSEGESPSSSDANSENTGNDGTLEIVYLQKQGDQQYFVDQAKGATEAASELGGVNVTVVNLGTDSNKAISELDTAIARGVDGIVIVVPDQAIGPQVIDKAKEAGIPLLASDDGIEDSAGNPAPFVGFNGTAMGTSVGEMAAELYLKEGWSKDDTKIMAIGKPDLSVCIQRLEGAKTAFEKAVGDNIPEIIDVTTDNSTPNAIDKASATMTANQGVKKWVVWGCNDESEVGGVTALQNAGVAPDNIIGVGLGAYLTCKDWQAGQETGNRAALYISGYDVGRSAIDAMVTALREGKDLPAETIAETHKVGPDNWEEEGVVCT